MHGHRQRQRQQADVRAIPGSPERERVQGGPDGAIARVGSHPVLGTGSGA